MVKNRLKYFFIWFPRLVLFCDTIIAYYCKKINRLAYLQSFFDSQIKMPLGFARFLSGTWGFFVQDLKSFQFFNIFLP
jgi:hypothetical protein